MKRQSLHNGLDTSQLVQLIKDQNEEGLSLLYQNYSGALLHMIMKIIPEQNLAEELLQDTFVKIWDKIHLFDPTKGRLFTWMAQIARNTSLDKRRLVGYQNRKQTEKLDMLVDSGNSPAAEMKVADSGLQKVISKLDPDKSRLIDLLYFQGYSQKDAAEKLDIPLGTVKTRIRSAIKELRTVLGGEPGLSMVLTFLTSLLYI
ncbi:MAG: sigma-70 family RNA polymerase sigma factor [Bacteroidetes bacterium]|nr:sigma-70 family RNA polymerase sigma factor [Bacteroidota bacterium]